jgi:hypothetical protein
MQDLDIAALNPGIRGLVLWLRQEGFHTVDSGDGATHDYGCDRPQPYVVMWVEEAEQLVQEARRLRDLLWGRGVVLGPCGEEGAPYLQASYDPVEGSCFLDLSNVTDETLGL